METSNKKPAISADQAIAILEESLAYYFPLPYEVKTHKDDQKCGPVVPYYEAA